MNGNISLKIRLYPNKTQKKLLSKNFGCARYMYNELLSRYNDTKKIVQYKEVYNNDNSTWLKEADTSIYANVVIHLKSAIKNYQKNKEHFSSPTYKTKHNMKQSYTTSVTNNNSRIIDDKHIRIPKVGVIKAMVHRLFDSTYKLKSVTISCERDGKYYASLLYEYESISENQTDKTITQMVGIDYSMKNLGVLSNGETIDYPKYLINEMNKISELERKLAKCEKNSNNWYKRKNDLARLFIKIRNKRGDFINKKILELARQYDIISIETLDLQEMSKNNHYGKSIYDNSYYTFTNKLEKKLKSFGKKLVKVDKYFPSSKRCSSCGNVLKELELSTRTYTCECGNIMDRDVNAARNIACKGFMTLFDIKI